MCQLLNIAPCRLSAYSIFLLALRFSPVTYVDCSKSALKNSFYGFFYGEISALASCFYITVPIITEKHAFQRVFISIGLTEISSGGDKAEAKTASTKQSKC